MATYTNRNDEEIIYMPGDFKLLVSMDAISGYNLSDSDVDFKCTFYTNNNRRKVLRKSEMIEGTEGNYIAPLHSTDIGKGVLNVLLEVDIPDDDFVDVRHEAVVIPTNLKIK